MLSRIGWLSKSDNKTFQKGFEVCVQILTWLSQADLILINQVGVFVDRIGRTTILCFVALDDPSSVRIGQLSEP